MDTIVLTTANSKTSEPHKYSYKLTEALRLEDHYICLSNLSIYYTWKNIREIYGNNNFYYRNEVEENSTGFITLPDGSYSVSDINNYLHMGMIGNGHATKDNYPISVYSNPTVNRVSVVVKPNWTLFLPNGMAKLLGFSESKSKIINSTHGDLVPQLERVETVMIHSNLAQNNFTQDSSLIFSFVPDSSFGTQLHQKPNFPLWRRARMNSDIRQIDIWFTDQLYRPLEIEDNILVEMQLAPRNFI